jgi:hypothetical protein
MRLIPSSHPCIPKLEKAPPATQTAITALQAAANTYLGSRASLPTLISLATCVAPREKRRPPATTATLASDDVNGGT